MHRAPAEVKIVCLLVFVLAVVATPREMFWPFAIYAAIVVVTLAARADTRCGGCCRAC